DMSGVRDACNAVLSLEPNNAEAISRRAMGDAALGDAPGARQGLERALSIAPQLVPARLALVDLLVDAGELAEANGVLEPALGQSENDAEVAYRLGSLRHAQERYLEAVSPLQRVVDAIPEHWGAQMKLAWVEASTGDLDAGLRRLENVGAASASADPFVMMAQLEAMYGRTSLAQSHFETALSIDGENTAALRGHADTLVSAGEFAAAKVSLERAIACDPYDGYAYEALADISRRADWDGPAFARLVALGQDESNSPDSRAAALFGAARLEDGAGEYGSAFDWATQANALMGGLFPFDAPAHDAFAGRIMQVFSSSSHFDPGFGSDEARPLFIVGMPRSGTSLVEQVLASHSDVRAAGEVMFFDDVRFASGASYPEGCQELTLSDCGLLRERYLAKLQHAGLDRRYVTDKLPPNFLYLGFIRLLFPLSKIIHCRRDAMDTGVSLFFQNFTAAQGNAFTYSLEHIGSYTLTYRRLMQHWRSVLDPAPYEIDYEAIISDPERSIRGLLDYLELDWEDACLSFHQTKRDVLTASRVQVRQPLYNSSVARSARYGDGLAPLRQLIGSSHD
ncbi:MAG: tetratricopeptide repeat protein, partial [Chromatiales bacterium]|nr:tetratricopeptide repeat protein [Chromatiales bacterium]